MSMSDYYWTHCDKLDWEYRGSWDGGDSLYSADAPVGVYKMLMADHKRDETTGLTIIYKYPEDLDGDERVTLYYTDDPDPTKEIEDVGTLLGTFPNAKFAMQYADFLEKEH